MIINQSVSQGSAADANMAASSLNSPMSYLQTGQVDFLRSQSSTHLEWNWWKQGRILTNSASVKGSMQIEQLVESCNVSAIFVGVRPVSL